LEAVTSAAREAGVQVHALSSGRSREGIDLGSDGVKALRKPAVGLVMCEGVAATEIGSAWFLLDQQLHLPASKLRNDRPLLRARALEAVNVLKAQAGKVPLDASRIGAVGFCFGGT
ncbi:peptidase M14, partial [Stenotrophomonas sp. 3diitr2024]